MTLGKQLNAIKKHGTLVEHGKLSQLIRSKKGARANL
jgi:hypothetical protein